MMNEQASKARESASGKVSSSVYLFPLGRRRRGYFRCFDVQSKLKSPFEWPHDDWPLQAPPSSSKRVSFSLAGRPNSRFKPVLAGRASSSSSSSSLLNSWLPILSHLCRCPRAFTPSSRPADDGTNRLARFCPRERRLGELERSESRLGERGCSPIASSCRQQRVWHSRDSQKCLCCGQQEQQQVCMRDEQADVVAAFASAIDARCLELEPH